MTANEIPSQSVRPPKPAGWMRLALFAAFAAMIGAALTTALLVNIFERKQEAKNPFYRVVELTEDTDDPEIWGKNFPYQYDSYKRTVDQERTKYGGSEAMPRTPTERDPRNTISRSKVEQDTRLKTMWAGYSFATDYRERRGHAYMLTDQLYTERQTFNPPGACINCHASLAVAYRKAGDGDPQKGFEVINKMPYKEVQAKYGMRAIACIDCHDPKTMQLRITRPAFINGIRALKASKGIKEYDVNRDATRQEMRSYACAQCHVNYYFEGPEKQLTFPWAKGLKIEEILSYYDEHNTKDWVHTLTGTPCIKPRHPEFEVWSQGIHAASGVACADCHMPYTREGALKVSDHHIQSPLLNINHACQTCHKWPEAELKRRVETIQDRHVALSNSAMDALLDLIADLKEAKDAGKSDAELKPAQDCQRKAQLYLDFVEAENSVGFHAPQETARILGCSIDFSRKGQIEIRKLRYTKEP